MKNYSIIQIHMNILQKKRQHLALALVLICVLSLAGCNGNTPGETPEKTSSAQEKNKAVVMEFFRALNDTNWQQLSNYVAPGYRHYSISDSGFSHQNWDYFLHGFKEVKKAFPDWQLAPDQLVAEGDMVAVRLTGSGTHTAPFAGMSATNKKVTIPLMTMHQLRDGKLVADWEMVDSGNFMQQLSR
jgi:steroid delta-isomerase-like uncharacterized protein